MSATANKIAQRFIGAAQKHPDERSEIFRQAAATFMGLAHDPKNARSAEQLAKIGLDFAGAATRERPAVMDDFQDLLQETAVAYHEVGDDPMDLVSRRREIHDERTKITPGSTSIAPESFNRDATLGRSAVVKFAPTQDEVSLGILQSQNVAFWQGVKKEAQAMTVDVSLGFLPPQPVTFGDPGELTSVRPFGEVEFGSDGNRTKIKFDLAFGKRLTVVGNYIAVTVGADPPMRGVIDGTFLPTVPLTVGASIGAFAAPSPGPTVLTEYVDRLTNVGPGVSDLIPIPLKAVLLLPIQTSLALGGTALIQFFSYGGEFISQNFYTQAVNSTMLPIPITGDISFIRIVNTGAATANFRLPFQLAM